MTQIHMQTSPTVLKPQTDTPVDEKAWEAAKGVEKSFWSMILKDMYEESVRDQEEFSNPGQTNVFVGPLVDAFSESIVAYDSPNEAYHTISASIYEDIKAAPELEKKVQTYERTLQ